MPDKTQIDDPEVFVGPDGEARCWWCHSAPEFVPYHDKEWGFPVTDDLRLFEKLSLEAFQSGLSWRTILNKREAFRLAFEGFDFHKVAEYSESDVSRLLNNASIVRHRGKIEAVINNAQKARELISREGSIAAFVWSYEPAPATRPKRLTHQMLRHMSTSPESTALAKELKKRGWKFVGPTTVYAFMQAMGLVNDHLHFCRSWQAAENARSHLVRPS